PLGRLIGLDQDMTMLELAQPRLADVPVTLVQANFDQLPLVLEERGLTAVDGVLADLGVCSDQIDCAERGFSFQQDGPLDMRLDPATRVFQALRIAVNDELGTLERFLAALPKCLKPGGRAVVISFHSLEDRRVEQAFRDRSVWQALTPKPVQAGAEELRDNPRARSA